MARQILVPIHRRTRTTTDAILSKIETVAEPGSKIIFLCPADCTRLADGFDEWLDARSRAPGSRIQTPAETRLEMERYGRAKQEEGILRVIAPVRERLFCRGCEVSVCFFEGSLRSCLKKQREDQPATYTVIRSSLRDEMSAVFRSFRIKARTLERCACR